MARSAEIRGVIFAIICCAAVTGRPGDPLVVPVPPPLPTIIPPPPVTVAPAADRIHSGSSAGADAQTGPGGPKVAVSTGSGIGFGGPGFHQQAQTQAEASGSGGGPSAGDVNADAHAAAPGQTPVTSSSTANVLGDKDVAVGTSTSNSIGSTSGGQLGKPGTFISTGAVATGLATKHSATTTTGSGTVQAGPGGTFSTTKNDIDAQLAERKARLAKEKCEKLKKTGKKC